MAENASNKRKWKGDHGGSPSQNKGHKVNRAHVVMPSNKKVYVGNPTATDANITILDHALQSAVIARGF
ncbi:hypothetical protein Tco_0076784, partial [Tanacetum coccineum]